MCLTHEYNLSQSPFDQLHYDSCGTCQYQLVGMCGQKQGLNASHAYVQTDRHLDSALHALVSVSSLLVKLKSSNTENTELSAR